MSLSDFVIPKWVKFIPYVVIALLFGALLITRATLADVKTELANEQTFVAQVATFANAKTGKKPEIMANLLAIGQTSLNRKAALERISSEAKSANERSLAADAALKREQEANARKYAAAQKTIADLQSRKGTGNAEADLKIIEEDSKAAWRGWK